MNDATTQCHRAASDDFSFFFWLLLPPRRHTDLQSFAQCLLGYNRSVEKLNCTIFSNQTKQATGTQQYGMIESDKYEEVINVSDFHKTLCESRNRGAKLREFQRWKETIEPINSLNSSISSIRIRQEISSSFASSKAKSYSTKSIYENKKSKRHYLRKKHIQNRQSPQLRWIIEDTDQASLYEDEHEQKQRLRRTELKRKRNLKRKKRWDKQRKYLIKMASAKSVTHTNIMQTPNNSHDNIEPDGVDMVLARLWKDRHRHHGHNIQRKEQIIKPQDPLSINMRSPISEIRTFAKKALLKEQNKGQQGHHAHKKVKRNTEIQKTKRKKKTKRDKIWSKKENAKREKLIKRREKLRETYAAFKAMTLAVEKAHMVVKNNGFLIGQEDVTKDIKTKEKNLLADFQRQQKRLILEMKRMTRLLNESKTEVYGSDLH